VCHCFVEAVNSRVVGTASAKQWHTINHHLDDPELNAFIAESSAHDLVVMVGMTRIEKEGMYNSVLVIQRGKLLGIYDFIMSPRGEVLAEAGLFRSKLVTARIAPALFQRGWADLSEVPAEFNAKLANLLKGK
jgi:predicted amidohydrolase